MHGGVELAFPFCSTSRPNTLVSKSIKMSLSSLLLLLVAVVSFVGIVDAFMAPNTVPIPTPTTSSTQLCSSDAESRGKNGKTKWGQRTETEISRFLSDFRTASGDIVDPYRSLRVPRSATMEDIKSSYKKLSRKLHPDMVGKSQILPGNCSNLDEVREEWEKVKLSYEILSDPKARKSYDRNSSVAEVLEDPSRAVGRAVVGGAFTAVGMGFGAMWKVGELAVKGVTAIASSSPEMIEERKKNVYKEKTPTELIVAKAEISAENNADDTNQVRVWTLEEMRAAAAAGVNSNKIDTPVRNEEPSSDAALENKESSSQSSNKVAIPIQKEESTSYTALEKKESSSRSSNKIDTSIKKEELTSYTALEEKGSVSGTDKSDEGVRIIAPGPSTSTAKNRRNSSNKVDTPMRKKEQYKESSNRADKSEEGVRMITPNSLASPAKNGRKKQKKSKVGSGGKGFTKKKSGTMHVSS